MYAGYYLHFRHHKNTTPYVGTEEWKARIGPLELRFARPGYRLSSRWRWTFDISVVKGKNWLPRGEEKQRKITLSNQSIRMGAHDDVLR